MIYENQGGFWFKSTHAFEQDIQAPRIRYKRFDQVWRGLRHILAHSPRDGWKSEHHTDIYIMEAPWSDDSEAPAIAVIYKFDTITVYLVRLIAKAIGQTTAYEADDG